MEVRQGGVADHDRGRILQHEQKCDMLHNVQSARNTGGDMLRGIAERLAKRQIRREGLRAFAAGVGAAIRRWPIERAQIGHRQDLVQEMENWLRGRIARTATPNGISHCLVMIRLTDTAKATVAWTYRSPAFERIQVAEGIAQVSRHVLGLHLDDYSTAQYIEAHLLSLGDVLRHTETQPGAKR